MDISRSWLNGFLGTCRQQGFWRANREMHSACTVWKLSDASYSYMLLVFSQSYIHIFNTSSTLSGSWDGALPAKVRD